MAKKRRYRKTANDKATWEDSRKEQLSLEPGSDEHGEWIEDLQMHDPFRPDDEMHEALEEANEEHVEEIRDRMAEKDLKPVAKKTMREAARRAQLEEAKNAASDLAKSTPSLDDDDKAKSLGRRSLDEIVYNDGVSEDEFIPSVLDKYM